MTEQLLEEPGLDRLTTVLIAKHAGLSVGTLYEYFPNKHAILFALASRWIEKMEVLLTENEVAEKQFVNWLQWYDSYFNDVLELYRQEKGVVRYYDMLVSILELRELDLKMDAMIVAYLTRSLLSFFPNLDSANIEVMNRMIITTMHNTLRFAVNMQDPQQTRMINNLHFVIQSLILKNAC